MTLQEQLDQRIEVWASIGHPAIMERYVARHGKVFTAAPYVGKRMTPNRCFENCSLYVDRFDGRYVEGYVLRPNIPLLIHHAWVEQQDGIAIDPTLERPEECEYMGVVFERGDYAVEIMRHKYYALLDTPVGINYQMMFERDPELEEIVTGIVGRRIA